jgi:hypothetical protein
VCACVQTHRRRRHTQVTAAEAAALRRHEGLLRVIAKVALQPPSDQTSTDQFKVVQIVSDLEEVEGLRIVEPVMNLFGAGGATQLLQDHHDPASITRGLDPTDAVLVRQILDNIAMGPVRTHRSGRGGGGGGGPVTPPRSLLCFARAWWPHSTRAAERAISLGIGYHGSVS